MKENKDIKFSIRISQLTILKMESTYKSVWIILFLSFLNSTVLFSQSSNQSIIYQAYISGKMDKWASVITSAEKEKSPGIEKKLELISYYYGYTGYLIGTKKTDTAERYIDKAEKLINEVLRKSPANATAFAYKGSFTGFRIGISKFKAISLGPESNASIEKALKIDPDNVQAIVDKGNSLFHTPKLFGGDKKEAVRLFQKAATILEKNAAAKNNWFYLNVLTLIARAYEQTGNYSMALHSYKKILTFEPDYQWVKNELYPACQQKLKN